MSGLVYDFILEARKRGFSDFQIRRALEEKNYPQKIIESSFESLQPKFKIKNQVCIFLSNEILSSLEKRAKKNMLTLSEQIEDILRRSSIRKKSSTQQEKIDDLLVACFSRPKKRIAPRV
jgi:DNA-binding transcriptional MerR regulator